MAGTNPGFDSQAFRDGIHFAMQMGLPPAESEQPLFEFPSQLVYTGSADDEDVPFDPDLTVQRTTPDPVRVPCAVEYFHDEGQLTNFGLQQPTRIRVTVLDEDYVLIEGCNACIIKGDRYKFRSIEPPGGLFDVGYYLLHFTAEQET